jgi:hypothetical protein
MRLGRAQPSPESLVIADQWASEARRILLEGIFDKFTITDLMVSVSGTYGTA